eukprot:CAMPEP_0203973728 /NCGR_PEP_ID=MMETSP0359-20131031/99739_1 /ASSEMBLY_ACC=CAM_ASM_000338 /TAXON_ID=268821 /ORGANISM="Scrippsiella Hangoei, Strain SHTV-5" /LENGTH=42 /DNA_ID= /DNA_START= /DNA_END= /DNA_ORIENTATION=
MSPTAVHSVHSGATRLTAQPRSRSKSVLSISMSAWSMSTSQL